MSLFPPNPSPLASLQCLLIPVKPTSICDSIHDSRLIHDSMTAATSLIKLSARSTSHHTGAHLHLPSTCFSHIPHSPIYQIFPLQIIFRIFQSPTNLNLLNLSISQIFTLTIVYLIFPSPIFSHHPDNSTYLISSSPE